MEHQFKVPIRQGNYILIGFEKAEKAVRAPEFPLVGQNIFPFGFNKYIAGKNRRR
jgi:hypothetical protein